MLSFIVLVLYKVNIGGGCFNVLYHTKPVDIDNGEGTVCLRQAHVCGNMIHAYTVF